MSVLGDHLSAFAKDLGTDTREHIERKIREATAPLLARIEQLESRPTLTYKGVWTAGGQYAVGSIVTCKGSVWHCNIAATDARPGETPNWQLMVRAVRDGKDLRA
jgi:hypothetical protein